MKVLLIGASTTEPDFEAWQSELQREGVPFDTVIGSTHTPISASTLSSTLADGTPVANYDAVIVAVGDDEDCSTGTCVSDLSTAEWAALDQYEHEFNIRQVSGYIYPGSGYGMNTPTVSGALDGTAGTLTADGQKVFPYLQTTAPITMDTGTYGYEATPVSTTNFDTLVSGPNGSSLVGVYTHPDGVEEMVETFDQNPNQLQAELLRHGALAWVTRGVFFGNQANYLEMDIDDTFTPDDSWDTTTHSIDYNDADALRDNPADVDYAAQWSAAHHFRMDQLFNMGGSVAYQADNGGSDPLLAEFQKPDPATGKPYADDFGWISHTYDTPYLDVGCATQNYIEAELNENTNVAAEAPGATAGTGGLGLTETTDPTVALGSENPHVFVPGNHSGFANLEPGNPATVDDPILDQDTASNSGGSLPAGTYEYAVTDQFTNSPTAGQSAADVTAPLTVTGNNGSVTLQWQAICHAADYVIYRGYEAPGASSYTWTLLPPASGSAYGAVSTPASATLPDNSSANPASTTDVSGGGETEQTYTDTGSAGTAEPAGWAPPSTENAVESPWEQNPYFVPALEAVGITAVGDDGSKAYPNPPDDQFGIGASYTGAEYAAGQTFVDGTAQVVPRHPINIYYNVSTDAQELDEYNTLYLPPSLGGTCEASSTTTCLTAPATFPQVIGSVVTGMFQYMMANDPRPSYVHQTNIMGQPPAGSEGTGDLPPASYVPPATPDTTGDGTLYQVLDPLLYEYNQYFNSTAPFEQLTEQAIANLLAEQSAWAANTTVSGYIQGSQVTITNSGSGAATVPLSGITTVGSPYAGTQTGWTSIPTGTSTYTAATTWPTDTVSVALSPASIAANGTSTSTATATVTADGNPVAGDPIAFTSSDPGEKVGTVTDNGNGTYTATITSSTTPGSATITATDPAVAPVATGQATLSQGVGPATKLAVVLSPTSILANGSSTSTATATVTDASGHAVTGDKVTFTSSDAGEKIGAVTNNGNGSYTASITSSTTAHSVTITATDSTASPSVSGQATLTQTAASTAPSNVTAPSITGTTTVGKMLTAKPGTWAGTAPITYTYQWQRCKTTCTAITGASASTYTLKSADLGAKIRVAVTATNTLGHAQAFSAEVGPVKSALTALLDTLMVPSGKAANVTALLAHNGYSARFTTPAAGNLRIEWVLTRGRDPILVAKVSVHISRTGKIKIKIALTPAGRELMRDALRLKLTAKGTLALVGLPRADATKSFTIKRVS